MHNTEIYYRQIFECKNRKRTCFVEETEIINHTYRKTKNGVFIENEDDLSFS